MVIDAGFSYWSRWEPDCIVSCDLPSPGNPIAVRASAQFLLSEVRGGKTIQGGVKMTEVVTGIIAGRSFQ
jgi:hypothetical protein